jgi:hypothetical protein
MGGRIAEVGEMGDGIGEWRVRKRVLLPHGGLRPTNKEPRRSGRLRGIRVSRFRGIEMMSFDYTDSSTAA